MKEYEAREKLCPMAMNAGENNWIRKCQGTDCMMWTADIKFETRTINIDDPIPEGFFVQSEYVAEKYIARCIRLDTGDCGLKQNVSMERG